MSCGLHHAHDANTKRDLHNQPCPPALGHAELLAEAFASFLSADFQSSQRRTVGPERRSCGLYHTAAM